MEPSLDLVQLLLETPFSTWKEKFKNDLLNNHVIPRPLLNCQTFKAGKNYRNFQNSWYSCFKWLCGSQYKQKLFCLPCLLFGTKRGCWNEDGFNDMVNALRSFQRHEGSHDHIKNWVTYKSSLINRVDIESDGSLVNEGTRLAVTNFNNNVHLNRRLMHLPISSMLFLLKQDLTLRNNNNDTIIKTKGNFEELLDLLINTSSLKIKQHYENIKYLFPANSEATQYELLVCISFLVKDFIKNEISETDFFSIIVHDTTDIPTNAQSSVVIRYVNGHGILVERFIGFLDVGLFRSAQSSFLSLNNLLGSFDYPSKLISQSYDGSCVMPGHLNELQGRVKIVAPQALFVPSVSHRLNLIIKQSTSSIAECRNFFANLGGIPLFFHAISKSKFMAECNIVTRIPTAQDTRWCSHSKVLKVLVEDWDGLRKTFHKLMIFKVSDENTIRLAESFYNKLNCHQFAFLAMVFKDLFDNFDILTNILRKESLDLELCKRSIDITRARILAKRNYDVLELHLRHVSEFTKVKMEVREEDKPVVIECYKIIYFKIIDVIINEMNIRFHDFESMSFLNLGNCKKFKDFSKKFPTSELDNLNSFYGSFFDRNRLKNELEYIYSDLRFRYCTMERMLRKLRALDLKEVFKEVYKFFTLLLTIPLSRHALDNGSSSLNRIKTFLRSPNSSYAGLNGEALLSIEKSLLHHLNTETPLHEDIIDGFAALKNRKIDLIFKKSIKRVCLNDNLKSDDKSEGESEKDTCKEDDCLDKSLKKNSKDEENEKDSEKDDTPLNIVDLLCAKNIEVNKLDVIDDDDDDIDKNNEDEKSAEEILGQPTDIVIDMLPENEDRFSSIPCNNNNSLTKVAVKMDDPVVSEKEIVVNTPKRKRKKKIPNPDNNQITPVPLKSSNNNDSESVKSSLTSSRGKRNQRGKKNVLGDVLNSTEVVAKKRRKTTADKEIEDDEDKTFLLSLLPAMKGLTIAQKTEFRMIISRELYRLKYTQTVSTASTVNLLNTTTKLTTPVASTVSTGHLSNTTTKLTTPMASLGNMALLYRTFPLQGGGVANISVQNTHNAPAGVITSTAQRFPVQPRAMLNNLQIIDNRNNAFPQQRNLLRQQLLLKPLSDLLPNQFTLKNSTVKRATIGDPVQISAISPQNTFSSEFITSDFQPVSYLNANNTVTAKSDDDSQLNRVKSDESKSQGHHDFVFEIDKVSDTVSGNDDLSEKPENSETFFRDIVENDSDSDSFCTDITVEEIKFEPIKEEPFS